MKLLLENWREYLTEVFDLSKYYVTVEESSSWMPGGPNSVIDYMTYGGNQSIKEKWIYGITDNLSFISLRDRESQEKIMSFYVQAYEGVLGHSDIRDISEKCYLELIEWPEEGEWCVRSNIDRLEFRTTKGDPLYCAGFDLDEYYEQASYRLGFLAIAFWETMLAILRDEYGAEYYGKHEAVLLGAGTSREAERLLQQMIKKGFLHPLKPEYFSPQTRDGLDDFEDVSGEYTIYKITDKAITKFDIED
jgi:hypothetical protein